jgi:class 3 adenylate cyclase
MAREDEGRAAAAKWGHRDGYSITPQARGAPPIGATAARLALEGRGWPRPILHGMRRLLGRVFGIGAEAGDTEDERLRKVLLLAAAVMVVPAAVIWGAIYWTFGETEAALVPWSYVVVFAVSIGIFGVTRRYVWFAVVQFTAFLILPFALMWSLGGLVSGSAVALWAWISPLGARIVGHRRAALLLLVAFGAGFALSGAVQSSLAEDNELPDDVVIALFVLNVVAVAAITLVLIDASSGGREGTLASMRRIVRRYLSPDVADAILADPERQELGGEIADVTILFADLGGYTTFAGDRSPHEVVELLNTLFGAAVPPILAEGGTPVQLPGDAVMAIFGAPRPAPDHARRAASAALAIRDRGLTVAGEHEHWPRFRIGLNSGEALVGNIGSDEFRNFTAIGDTVNMAQRFQTLAEPGQVVVGPETASRLGDTTRLAWLGEVRVKGKDEPVRPSVLLALGVD